jgi:F-type H+-transporting ATPase subunit epsilon
VWRRLSPGILIYETEAEGEVYVAVDEGVLVKTGLDVLVSVRNGPSAERTSANCAMRWKQEFLTWTSGSKACAR